MMFWPVISVWHFAGFFVWIDFLLAGDWLMSPKFQMIHFLLTGINCGEISGIQRLISSFKAWMVVGLSAWTFLLKIWAVIYQSRWHYCYHNQWHNRLLNITLANKLRAENLNLLQFFAVILWQPNMITPCF